MEDSPPGQPGSHPPPQRPRAGGVIRWAVGDPHGLRSQSWTVAGNAHQDDVYIGPRERMGSIKLSLHRSGRWRMAWDGKSDEARALPDGVDRVLTRWEPQAEIRPGWRHVVTVLVPDYSVMRQRPERRLGKVAFFLPPVPGHAMWFRVLKGEPGNELAVTDADEVGTLPLQGGGAVGVVVHAAPLPLGSAMHVEAVRNHIRESVTAAGARGNRSFAWGSLDDGAVFLLDSGPIEPDGPAPESSRGAPGRITYVRRFGAAS